MAVYVPATDVIQLPCRLLLYVAGLVYLSQLPRDEFNHRSFIDENALMVGLVRREFSDPNSISRYSRQLEGVYGSRCELAVQAVGVSRLCNLWLQCRGGGGGVVFYSTYGMVGYTHVRQY